jgi:hypothetical protein
VCATEVTTSEEISRFASALEDILAGRAPIGVEAGAAAGRDERPRAGVGSPR